MDTTLIVGLGNPGGRYASTRHNAGFRCLDWLAAKHGLRFDRRVADAVVATGSINDSPVVLAKPQTFMNLSGRAVRGLLAKHNLSPAQLIVISDDLDLPVGRVRLRERGSSGGQKGVRSIIDALGSSEFRRIRVGIGRPAFEDAVEYVLRPFPKDEEPIVRQVVETVAAAVECILSEGFAAAMNKYNRAVNEGGGR